MRVVLLMAVGLVLMALPTSGLAMPKVDSLPSVAAAAAPNRWVDWYEDTTGAPAPLVLMTLGSVLDSVFPQAPRNEDETPEVHAGSMRNYCNIVLHDDCVYNDPTANSYECNGGIAINQGLVVWKSDPSIVLMNYTIYGTYTEDWVDDTVEEETGIDSPLTVGGEARHVVLVGTTCYFDVFNDIFAQTSGIGFYFPS